MKSFAFAGSLAFALLGFGCGRSHEAATTTTSETAPGKVSGPVSLNGAGATFPNPLYSKWIAEYAKSDGSAKINYQSVGSGAGIKQVSEETVDFGASDAPMSDEQLAHAPRKLLHIPMTLGAVAIAYSLPGITDLKISPDVLAAIFLGDVKMWNDPKITALNPTAKLPSTAIAVVHRTDGSGTTAVFTSYLAKVSEGWKKIGTGTSVSWPVGVGAKGNEGVTGLLKTTPGALGYIELAYALQSKLTTASLENKAGKFVAPTLEGITAAATSFAASVPDDLRMSIVNAEGDASYPIASFSYVLVYEDTKSFDKGQALAKFLWWGVHDGQKLAPALDYAPLPAAIVAKDEAKLKSLKSGEKALLGT